MAWCQRSSTAKRRLSHSNPVTDHRLLLSVRHLSLGNIYTTWLLSVLLSTLLLSTIILLHSIRDSILLTPSRPFWVIIFNLLFPAISCTNRARTVTMSGSHGATCLYHWLPFWLCLPKSAPPYWAKRLTLTPPAKWQRPLLAGRRTQLRPINSLTGCSSGLLKAARWC